MCHNCSTFIETGSVRVGSWIWQEMFFYKLHRLQVYKVTRQNFKTISNNYISDDTVLKKYCMLCQRLQAVNELLLPFHMKCIHRVLVYSELFWHIAHNRLYLYQYITHCLITAVCFWSATLHCSLYHHLQVGPLLLNFALTSVLRLIIWPPQ